MAARANPSAWLGRLATAQGGRVGLWGPIGFAFGAAIWLSAPVAAPSWLLWAATIGWAALAWIAARAGGFSHRPWRDRLFVATGWTAGFAAWLCAGAIAADLRTAFVAAPRLAAPVEAAELVGWVAAVEPRDSGVRLKVRVQSLAGVTAPPVFVRLAVDKPISPGRLMTCRVNLRPPDPPLMAGGFDPQRRAYFDRVGASGFVVSQCRIIAGAAPSNWSERLSLWVAAVRRDLAEMIARPGTGDSGAFAAAVVTGDVSLMSQTAREALQNSGLAHLVSVSGLHMSLVAGIAFWFGLRSLALVRWLALRAPVRKLAAVFALASAGAYLVISGASVPAERAFVMTTVALCAILVDRPAISMRGLAVATAVVVALRPESVLEAGFQMSFAATGALVAWFEARRDAYERMPSPGWFIDGLQKLGRGIGAVLMTSVIAGLATDPLVAFHFQRFTLYGLPANLVVEPIVTFVIAPSAAAAALLSAIGLAEPALVVMRWGLDMVLAVAAVFADRPEAILPLPNMPQAALGLLLLGMVWAMIWRGVLRWGGLVFVGCALGLIGWAPQPIAAISDDARVVWARSHADGDGWRLIRPARGGDFDVQRLQQRIGLNPQASPPPAPMGCLAGEACQWTTPGGRTLRHIPRAARAGAPTDPPLANIARAPPACPQLQIQAQPSSAAATIAAPATRTRACAFQLKPWTDSRGGALIYETADGLTIERARPRDFHRPWTISGG